MSSLAAGSDLQLPEVDPVNVSFNNLFVGTDRVFHFESGADKYAVVFKEKNLGLMPKVLLKVRIAGFDAEILLSDLSTLGKISEKFSEVDLKLFDDTTKVLLLNCLFEREISSFVAKIGLDLRLESVRFEDDEASEYEKEIGVNIVKNDFAPVTFNVKLPNGLLAILNAKFEKIPADGMELDGNFQFQWYIEVGRTSLSLNDYENLEEYDIVFLDEDSSVRTATYEIKGLDDMRLSGKLTGCNLVLDSVQMYNF
ncbi:MAG: hypothetical protein LBI61_00030 [Puniceicoccales bacterium]|jgi:hypothetical protein|nr:hypothetical protein [Puniceicoccales bacterium]